MGPSKRKGCLKFVLIYNLPSNYFLYVFANVNFCIFSLLQTFLTSIFSLKSLFSKKYAKCLTAFNEKIL